MTGTLGLVLPPDLPAAEVMPYARQAERLGFGQLWVVEDCFLRGGIAQAAAVLAVTSSIRVGVGILPAGARNPAFAAMELASLAELFPGRVLVGLGHGMPGWMRQVGAWPASPLTLLTESLDAIRALLHGERVTMAGRHVQLDGVQLAHRIEVVPPVLAGVRGPKSLQLSGRHADGTILAEPLTPEYLAASRESLAAPAAHLIVGYTVAAVHDDPARARDQARAGLQWVGEPDWWPHLAPLDFGAELAALRAASADRAAFTAALPDEWVDRLAVVGDPAAARRRLEQLFAAGADAVVLYPGTDPSAALTQLARLL
jgi:5,10-methylenetetrahydromethanopterin reductase